MKVLIIGGTRFFGIHTVNALLAAGHQVTLATRGRTPDSFGNRVSRLTLERTDPESMKRALAGLHFDVVIDKIAYCSKDIKHALDVLNCNRYIYMSSTAVYDPKHVNTKEEDFDPLTRELIWCERGDFPYAEVKRQAECALWQVYGDRSFVSVRYPFVVGEDDYTKRLLFYVEHTLRSIPMYIDNPDRQMGFLSSKEAGDFMAFLVDSDYTGAINGCSVGTVSLREILAYVEQACGIKAILSDAGDPAPYNGEVAYSINTERAETIGYTFRPLGDWLYGLIDYYIEVTRHG
ncbi:MAG: NAD-dependent epimerase/dehydratase family protein [Clostridia bacterium]|nr:NAD-dependent epimerase/dehydratase family protein [Clostridia bacterium]